MKRLLDRNPETGITEWFVGSEDGKTFQIVYEQDAQPVIEENKRKQSAGRAYYARDNEMWRVASIPITVQYKWMVEEGIDVLNPDHMPAVKRKLNDPDWRWLKTADVRI